MWDLTAGREASDWKGRRMTASQRLISAAAVSVTLGVTLAAQTAVAPAFIFSHQDTRMSYLGNAVIWRDPGHLTPEQIKAGPPAAIPEAVKQGRKRSGRRLHLRAPGLRTGRRDREIQLSYEGRQNGSHQILRGSQGQPRGVCRGRSHTPDVGARVRRRSDVRVDGQLSGLPRRSTERPGSQAGATDIPPPYEPRYVGTIITSSKDPDQGWKFGEVDRAISSLPASALRVRQRMQFDALTLWPCSFSMATANTRSNGSSVAAPSTSRRETSTIW